MLFPFRPNQIGKQSLYGHNVLSLFSYSALLTMEYKTVNVTGASLENITGNVRDCDTILLQNETENKLIF